jgi:N-acyl-D-aspartate/D-glutamate deacylase
MKLDEPEVKRMLADPAFRGRLKDELARRSRRMFTGEWERAYVAQAADPANASFEGQSIAALAARKSLHPIDFMLDLALAENLDTLFTATLLNSDEDAVGRMLNDENAILSLSDAGAHLTFLCDAGFGLHFLGYWVRERKVMPIERAVKKLTAEPARLLGIRDRGTLAEGNWADLLLFDPRTIGRGASKRVYDLPAGASRIDTPGMGVHGVWINGRQIANDKGLLPGAPRAGQVLRSLAS